MLSDNQRMLNSDGLVDPDSTLKYRDILRGAGEQVESSSTVRAVTPSMDNLHRQFRMHETRQTVQVFSKRSCGSKTRNSKNNSDLMSGP